MIEGGPQLIKHKHLMKCGVVNTTAKRDETLIYKAVAVSVVLRGSEAQIMTMKSENEIQFFQKLLRGVKKCTRADRNPDIRDEQNVF